MYKKTPEGELLISTHYISPAYKNTNARLTIRLYTSPRKSTSERANTAKKTKLDPSKHGPQNYKIWRKIFLFITPFPPNPTWTPLIPI